MTEQDWLAGEDPRAMLEYLEGLTAYTAGKLTYEFSPRKLRLFACACCRQVWDLLRDPRSRRAVEVAERYADGEGNDRDLNAAFDGALAVEPTATRFRSIMPCHCTLPPGGCPGGGFFSAAAEASLGLTAQAALLREVVGNPFRRLLVTDAWVMNPQAFGFSGVFDKRWLTPDVLALARAAYEGRLPDGTLDPVRLAVLADALEEAGCTEEAMPCHLRGEEYTLVEVDPDYRPGQYSQLWHPLRAPHVRGCWATDLILGRE